MDTFIQLMKALSDPNRVRMVKLIQHRELCVCEIQQLLGLAQSTASKHLKILETAGLVQSRRDGLWAYYRLADGGASPFASTLLGNLRHWLEDDEELAQLVETVMDPSRPLACA